MTPKGTNKNQPGNLAEKGNPLLNENAFLNPLGSHQNHDNQADTFFKALEPSDTLEFDPHQDAIQLLYHGDGAILKQLYQDLRQAGGYRPGIKDAVERALQASKPGVVYNKDQLDAVIIAMKQELNNAPPYFDAIIRQKRKLGHYTPSVADRGYVIMKEDAKTRQDFGRNLIIFIDLKKDISSFSNFIPQKKPKKVSMTGVMEALTVPPKELCYGQIRALVQSGADLSSVTRAINEARKGGDIWELIRRPLLTLGITLPQDRNELIAAVTSAVGTTEENFAKFIAERWPDPGNAIGLTEIKHKKWSDRQKQIATRCVKSSKLDIPVRVAEVFVEIYNKHLESNAFDEGMGTHLKHADNIPEEIVLETGATALDYFVRRYNETAQIPTLREWIDTLLLVQNERPDLILGQDGKYHYQATEFNAEKMIADAAELDEEKAA